MEASGGAPYCRRESQSPANLLPIPAATMQAAPPPPAETQLPPEALASARSGSETATGGLGQLKPTLIPRSVWVLGDQAIVSLTNFTAAVVVGRVAGNDDLGVFGLGLWTMMMVYAIAKALVWTPYTTTSPHLEGEEHRGYSGSSTLHLLAIAGLAGCVMLFASLLMRGSDGATVYSTLFLCMTPYLPIILLREHIRRLCLARLGVVEVLIFDLVAASSQLLAIFALYNAGVMNGSNVFLALSACLLVTVGWFAYRWQAFQFSLSIAKRDWQRNWPFSKWLAGGAAAVQGGEQGVKWVVSAMYGLSVVGQLASAQQIIQIVNPVLLGISNYFGPASANVYGHEGLRGLWRHTLRSTLMLILFVTAAFAALVLTGPLLIDFIFGGRIQQVSTWLIASLAMGVFSTIIHVPIEFASLARSRGRLLFYTAVLRLAANSTVGVALIWYYGAVGVGFGMLAGNCLSLSIQWFAFAKEARNA